MHKTLTGEWSLRAFGPSLQARRSLSCLARKNASGRTTCPSDGPRLEALSAGLRMAEDIFTGAFMLTHIGRKILCKTLGTLMAAPLGLSVCRRLTSENFTSTLMLTQLAL